MRRIKSPELLNITEKQLEDISLRLGKNSLSPEDIKIVTVLLTTYSWLMKQLSRSKITIHRLKHLFSYSSEKKKRLKNSNSNVPPSNESSEQKDALGTLATSTTEEACAEINVPVPEEQLGVPPENK